MGKAGKVSAQVAPKGDRPSEALYKLSCVDEAPDLGLWVLDKLRVMLPELVHLIQILLI